MRITPRLKGAGQASATPATPAGDVPTVKADGPKPKVGTVPALRRDVRTELALTSVVLLCAGGLTLLPRPSGPATIAASALPTPTHVVGGTPGTTAVAAEPTALPTATPGLVTALNTVG